eukprot:COSAG01_NODE_4879_length_4656_cov_5.636384_7_plen_171_part_00
MAAMVQQGAQVAYVDLRASGAAVGFVAKGSADAAAAAATTPHGAHFIQCDVSRPDEIEAAVKRALGLLGGLDVLVNNVGVHVEAGRPCHETSVWAFDQMIAVNLRSYFVFSQLCLREAFVPARRGAIVNIGSVHGFQNGPGLSCCACCLSVLRSIPCSALLCMRPTALVM